jgi:altronate dehydratase
VGFFTGATAVALLFTLRLLVGRPKRLRSRVTAASRRPGFKVATRDDLARRWHDLMDVNAGRIATGEATIEQVGWELFQLMLDVASGKKTWTEHWKLHNALTLFNPAPIT